MVPTLRRVREWVAVGRPDMLHELGARQDLADMAHEIFEHVEFFAGQMDGPARADDRIIVQVYGKILYGQGRLVDDRGAAGHGLDPGSHLFQGEWLGHIVVGAVPESLELGVGLVVH